MDFDLVKFIQEGKLFENMIDCSLPTQNLDLNTEAGFDTLSVADDILDFTERNPFGEVDE